MSSVRCYVGSYTDAGDQNDTPPGLGVSCFILDQDTGHMHSLTQVMDLHNPSWIQAVDGQIWAASEHIEEPGKVHLLNYSGEGQFNLTQSVDSGGLATCHLLVEAEHVSAASYLDGRFRRWKRSPEGLGDLQVDLQYEGKGPNADRQECPHAHQVISNGTWLWVCDLGSDRLWIHNTENGEISGSIEIPAGYGPRHAVLDPEGGYLWVWCELYPRLLKVKLDASTGHGQIIKDIDLAELSGISELNDGAAIRWHPDGKTLLITARTPGLILLLDMSDDEIQLIGKVDCHRTTPRDASFSPCGQWLIIAEQSGHRLTCHDLGAKDDNQPPVSVLETGSPVCLSFE